MTFKLNMSDKEAESKDFEYPPSGEYVCRISDLTLTEVKKPGDNFGNPYWKLTLVVEEGEYKGTSIITNVMLYAGALYSIKQLCEALHPEFIVGNDLVLPSAENGAPSPDPWLGEVVKIKGTKYAANTRRRDGTNREYDEFNVRFRPVKSNKKTNEGGLPIPS